MKRRINNKLLMIAVLAILSTTLLITGIYYDLFCTQVMGDLETYTELFEHYEDLKVMPDISFRTDSEKLRITVINKEGYVLFDNEVNSKLMDNHINRPEINDALAHGEGSAIRKSQTLGSNTFYYAVQLENGFVLRVAKEAGSIYHVFISALPSLIIVVAVLIILCMMLANFLTKKLVKPIETLSQNLDNSEDSTDYEELNPFIEILRQQHKDIIKNAKIRQEFTANVSHELKTPLTAISGYAELIENGMASQEDTIRFAEGIHKSSNRLLILINDIIRLSELDGTEEEAPFERINLYQLAVTCADMLSMNADKHNVSIDVKGTDCFVKGDRQMLEELLYNLCDNAIRYNNENGKIWVQVYPKNQSTVLVVKDTGIGISPKHQERIFERFYRVDKSRSKSTGGTGLGLAIVKHILSIHNADIDLVSEAGKGTTITITFEQ